MEPTKSYYKEQTSIFHGDVELCLFKQDLDKLTELVETFWLSDEEVTQIVSRKTIKKEVVELIWAHRLAPTRLNEAAIHSLFKRVKSEKNKQWHVFRSLYGISLSTASLTLGPFTIYTWENYRSLAEKEELWLDKYLCEDRQFDEQCGVKHAENPLLEDLGNLIIGVQVEARDVDKARELADECFYQFENIVSYMLAEPQFKYADIFNYFNDNRSLQSFIQGEDYISFNTEKINHGANILYCDLNSPFFTDGVLDLSYGSTQYWVNAGYSWIWEAFGRSNLTEREKRVLAAIEWVGKGVRDNDMSRALVQYTFALETLFTLDKDAVTNQLAEFSAFVYGSSPELRQKIAKQVKEIYGSRSAIAHGRTKNVPASEVAKALRLVKALITKLITDPELSSITTDQEFRKWCDGKKYT